jgi:hypothetical protein
MNALRISESKIIRKIYGTIKEGDSSRVRRNTEIRYVLQGEDIVKFIKSSRIRWYGHVERMQNQRTPKQIAAATIEGTRKIGRPRKRWKNEVEEDLNIMGIQKVRWRSSEMEKDCTANRGPQQTVVLEEKKKKKKKKKKK